MGSAGEVHRLIICKLGLKYYLNEELHAWKNASSYIFNIVDSNDIGFMETGGGGGVAWSPLAADSRSS